MMIAWLIWRRNRTLLTGVGACLVVMALLANTLLIGVLSPLNGLFSPSAATADDSTTANYGVVIFVFTAAIMALLWCSVIVSMSAGLFNAGATGKDYTYPAYLMRAPVKSIGLAAWPILIGSLSMALMWFLAQMTILQPLGFAVPIGESVLNAALAVAFVPAAMWSPLSTGLKGLFMLILGSALTCVLVSAHRASSGISYVEWVSAAITLGVIAIVGLGRMRQGELNALTLPEPMTKVVDGLRASPQKLTSAVAALRSLEWRGTGGALPWAVVVLTIASLAALLVPGTFLLSGHSPETQGIHVVLWAVVMQFFVVGIPFYTAMLSLVQVGNDYLLTRPMGSQSIFAGRIIVGARSAALTVLLSGVLFAAWLMTPANDGSHRGSLGALLMLNGGQALVRAMCFYSLMWIMVIFRLRLDGYSTSLSASQSFGGWNLVADYLFMALVWVNVPQLCPIAGSHLAGLPTWIYLVAVAKAVLGACVLGYSLRRHLVTAAALARAAATWIGIAFVIYFAAIAALPEHSVAFVVLATGVFLGMPLVRLSLGPVLLDRNRHR
jgi:hypothetical protein